MSRTLSVTEPHPTVPAPGAYLMGGRGGVGNYKRYSSTEVSSGPDATGPASRVSLSRPSGLTRTVAAGRGGAGNMYSSAEQRVFHFDEEMVRRRELQSPIYHIGRGGAANFVDENKSSHKAQRSGSSSSVGSSESAGSLRRGLDAAVGMLTRKPPGQ